MNGLVSIYWSNIMCHRTKHWSERQTGNWRRTRTWTLNSNQMNMFATDWTFNNTTNYIFPNLRRPQGPQQTENKIKNGPHKWKDCAPVVWGPPVHILIIPFLWTLPYKGVVLRLSHTAAPYSFSKSSVLASMLDWKVTLDRIFTWPRTDISRTHRSFFCLYSP